MTKLNTWEPNFTRKPLIRRMQETSNELDENIKPGKPLLKKMGDKTW